MKIGFVQPEEEIIDGVGFIETAFGRDSAEMTWPRWALMVFLHYCVVQVIFTLLKAMFQFFFTR